jgi:peptidoglycan L-alanyl-D-glutamate endopeptidase CwlK
MIDSRNIDDLHPHVAKLCRQFIAKCKDAGIDVSIISTYRDNARQNQIFAQGRSRPGKIVTYARGGQSWHNYRLAFDFAIMKHGKIDWGDRKSYLAARKIGESLGLEGLSFELAHLQLRGGLTLAQAAAGRQPGFAA